ncbi:MAG: hypothetical protein K9K86_10930 [Pseudomonadales bacterium]|nr:hypothetical protein [Pseudomonadales bacterium]
MSLSTILMLGAVILCIIVIIAVAVGLSAKGESDTVEHITEDGKRLTFSKWDAMKISKGAHPTYYFDENHNLKRRKGS